MAHGYDVVALVWHQRNATWERHMVRECGNCLSIVREPLVYVDMDALFCLHCLSSQVIRDRSAGAWVLRCRDCDGLTLLEDLEDEEVEFEDDDEIIDNEADTNDWRGES